MADFSNSLASAIGGLQTKVLGGVTKDSAINGMKRIAKEAEEITNQAEKRIDEEIRKYNDAQATINKVTADLQNEKKENQKIQLALDAKNQETIELAKKNKSRLHVKTLRTELPDGRVVTTRIYPKGGYVQRTQKPNGEVNIKLITPNGKMKSIKAAGKEITSIYDTNTNTLTKVNNGSESSEIVNVKKLKAEKPRLVSQTEPHYTSIGKESQDDIAIQFEKMYSDGSKETILTVKERDGKIRKTESKFEKDGKVILHKRQWPNAEMQIKYNKDKIVSRTKVKENQFEAETVTDYVNDPLTNKKVPVKSIYTSENKKTTYTAIKTEDGLYTGDYTFVTKDLKTKKVIDNGTIDINSSLKFHISEPILYYGL